jgi:hypothetical protein
MLKHPIPATPTRSDQPKPEFVALTRDPNLPAPKRFEPTVKKPGELVLTLGGFVEVGNG